MDGVYVDLRESGLLWLINRQVFHPRGYALAMALDDDGGFMGWILQGDGREPWSFATDIEAEPFAAAQRTLAPRDTTPEPLKVKVITHWLPFSAEAESHPFTDEQRSALAGHERHQTAGAWSAFGWRQLHCTTCEKSLWSVDTPRDDA